MGSSIHHPRLVRFHTEVGARSALYVGAGRKRHRLIFMDAPEPLRVTYTKGPPPWREITVEGEYPLERALAHFERVARERGATREALRALEEVRSAL